MDFKAKLIITLICVVCIILNGCISGIVSNDKHPARLIPFYIMGAILGLCAVSIW